MAGKTGSICLVTIVDRCSRFLLAGKVAKKTSALVANKMIALLAALPMGKCRTITPDRGKELAAPSSVTEVRNELQFYFPDSHAPRQRGTNENTNGLLHEYLPKAFDMALSPNSDMTDFILKFHCRHSKCLAWETPFEVFFIIRCT